MGKILVVGTYATDDPTRASMPFVATSGALNRDHEPGVVLMGEAVYLMNDQIVDDIQGVGFPPLRELFDKAVDNGVPFYIWGPCSLARGVGEEALEGKNAQFATPDDFADLMMEYDRVLSYWRGTRFEVPMTKVPLREAAAESKEFWSQHTVGEANGNLFKVAKGIGSTNWHQHDDQDEVFVVLGGQITVQLRTGDVELEEGDLFIVSRGVEHCPQAHSEVHLLLVGPEITSTPEGGKPDWSATGQTPN